MLTPWTDMDIRGGKAMGHLTCVKASKRQASHTGPWHLTTLTPHKA